MAFELAAELGQVSPGAMLAAMRPSEFGLWCAYLRVRSLERQGIADEDVKPVPKPIAAMRAWFGHLVKKKGT